MEQGCIPPLYFLPHLRQLRAEKPGALATFDQDVAVA